MKNPTPADAVRSIKGDEQPESSGYYPVYQGISPSPVIGYWNNRDAVWYVNGYRVREISFWLGPHPLPERKGADNA